MLPVSAIAVLAVLWAAQIATTAVLDRAIRSGVVEVDTDLQGLAAVIADSGEGYVNAVCWTTLLNAVIGASLIAFNPDVADTWALAQFLGAVGVSAVYGLTVRVRLRTRA